MARSRTNFTDAQKAEIYTRDRATCCFSGANLWLPDAPPRPGWQRDWVDHVKPASRGGKSEVGNGVCASHTYNAKKRHNTADNAYLFETGRPTAWYYEIFGYLDPCQAWAGYSWDAETDEEIAKAHAAAEGATNLSGDVRECICRDFAL